MAKGDVLVEQTCWLSVLRAAAGLATAATLLPLALIGPSAAMARDLVVYAEPTLGPVVHTLGQMWRERSGVRVNVFVARSELSFAQIEHGARCDVIFALAGDSLDEATNDKLVKEGATARVFRNSLVLISRDMLTVPSSDILAMLAGKKPAIADPERDVGGSYGVTALRAAGVTADPQSESIAVAESSAGVVQMLLDDKAHLGVVFATDAAPRPEFKAMSLDPATYPAIEYVVGEAVNAQSNVRGFVEFLKTEEAKAAIKAAGLEPISN